MMALQEIIKIADAHADLCWTKSIDLGIIKNVEVWKEMRRVRDHVTHEYPDHPDFTTTDLNKIMGLTPQLLDVLNKIKAISNQQKGTIS